MYSSGSGQSIILVYLHSLRYLLENSQIVLVAVIAGPKKRELYGSRSSIHISLPQELKRPSVQFLVLT